MKYCWKCLLFPSCFCCLFSPIYRKHFCHKVPSFRRVASHMHWLSYVVATQWYSNIGTGHNALQILYFFIVYNCFKLVCCDIKHNKTKQNHKRKHKFAFRECLTYYAYKNKETWQNIRKEMIKIRNEMTNVC